MNRALQEKIVAHLNRKSWWHVPPVDKGACRERGKFLASSFREAEFWGRPLDDPQKVSIVVPLIGDEKTIETRLLGKCVSCEGFTMEKRWKLDARMKKRALRRGYDSILLMSSKGFSKLNATGKLPRSLELNVLVSIEGFTTS